MFPLDPFCKSGNICRGCSAASAGDPHTRINQFCHLGGKFLHRHVKYRLPITADRQTRIGLEKNGNRRAREQFFHDRAKLTRTERAVCSDRIHTHALQHGNHRLGRCARHQFSIRAIGIGNKHGEATVFLGGKHRRLGFKAIVHGLDEDQIDAVFDTQSHRFGKNLHRILKFQITIGLEQFSRRANVERNKTLAAHTLARRLGVRHRTCHDLLQFLGGKLETVRPKGVGAHNVAPCLVVRLMNILNDFGMCQIPGLGIFPGM